MSDLIAAIAALALVFFALKLADTLRLNRRAREGARSREHARGRVIVAELPVGEDLTLITQDDTRVFVGDRPIEINGIRAVRVLVNGQPIASTVSSRFPEATSLQPTTFQDQPEGIARDRWDVAIETGGDTILVECGAIRERISQELARKIYDAVSRAL